MAQPDFSTGTAPTFIPEVLPMILSRNAVMVDSFEGGSDISIGRSGHEKRVAGWSSPLIEVDLGPGVRTLRTLRLLREFYRRMYGATNSFLFHHFLYHTTAAVPNLKDRRPGAVTMLDEQFGTGDGVTTGFQLSVAYGGAPEDVFKLKTDNADPLIAVNGVLQDGGSSPPDYTLDLDPATATGFVEFATPPGDGEALTWGGEYYLVMRFRDRRLDVSFQNYDRGFASVVIKQVRDFV